MCLQQSKLSSLVRLVPDASLHFALLVVSDIPEAWPSLDADVSHRFKTYVGSLPSDKVDSVEWLVSYPPLAEEAKKRIRRATRKELRNGFFFGLSKDLGNKFVELYLESKSYDEANDWAKELIGYKDDFNEEQVTRLLIGSAANQEILGSFRFGDLLRAFRSAKVIPAERLDAALRAAGLETYVEEDADFPF
jgi:hypothetical protein